MPAAAIASETSATRPAAARQTTLRGLLGEVMAVEDQLHDHVVAGERGAGDAGVAVPERPHRVEEMRDGGGAAVEGAVRLLGGRVGVAARDDDAARAEQVDQLERAVELRCERHLRDAPGREQALEQRGIGVAAGRDRMRAEAERREKRPLEVRADHPRPDRARAGSRRARRRAPPRAP